MKKLITIPAAMLVCAGAYAQGQLAYSNNGSTRVMQTVGGVTSISAASTSSGVEIELFYQLDSGGAAPAAITSSGVLGNWEATQTTIIQAIPGGGEFNGPILNLADINVGNTGAGQTVWIDIVGWNNSQTSLANAVAGGSSLFGSSAVFAQVTGNPNALPQPTAYGPLTTANPGAFTGLTLNPVPEPTTIALGGIGAAALLAFRRRK
jgi:hypothetical protein